MNPCFAAFFFAMFFSSSFSYGRILYKCGYYPGTNVLKPCDTTPPGVRPSGPEVCSPTQLRRGCGTSTLETSPPQYICECPTTTALPSPQTSVSTEEPEDLPAKDVRSSAVVSAFEKAMLKFKKAEENEIKLSDLSGEFSSKCIPGRGMGVITGVRKPYKAVIGGLQTEKDFRFRPDLSRQSPITTEVRAEIKDQLLNYGGFAFQVDKFNISAINENHLPDKSRVWRDKSIVRKLKTGALLVYTEIEEFGPSWTELSRDIFPEIKSYRICETIK